MSLEQLYADAHQATAHAIVNALWVVQVAILLLATLMRKEKAGRCRS